MAFVSGALITLSYARNVICQSTCSCRSRFAPSRVATRCVRPTLLRASYAEDLATRTCDIVHSDTDALILSVRRDLDRGGPSAVSAAQVREMVVHLADTRGMARLGLVEAFGRIGSSAVPDLLTGLKQCPSPVVRRSCGKALAKIGDPTATDTLIDTLLHDEDTVTRSSAAGALAKMGSLAVPRLLSVIASVNSSMTAKGHAAWAISFMQGDASDALFDHANDPSPDVRLAVVAALGSVAIGDALPSMGGSGVDDWVEGDTDPDDDGPANGTEVANQRKRAIECMVAALSDESMEVRAEAVTALANAGVESAATQIDGMFDDSDMELRRTVAFALMKLKHGPSVVKLRACAANEGEDESLRNVARLAAQSISQYSEDDDWE